MLLIDNIHDVVKYWNLASPCFSLTARLIIYGTTSIRESYSIHPEQKQFTTFLNFTELNNISYPNGDFLEAL